MSQTALTSQEWREGLHQSTMHVDSEFSCFASEAGLLSCQVPLLLFGWMTSRSQTLLICNNLSVFTMLHITMSANLQLMFNPQNSVTVDKTRYGATHTLWGLLCVFLGGGAVITILVMFRGCSTLSQMCAGRTRVTSELCSALSICYSAEEEVLARDSSAVLH